MIDKLMEKYFDKSFSTEKKAFYLVSFSALVMFVFSLLSAILMNFGIIPVVCITMGMILLIAIIYFADLTDRINVCSVLELVLLNILIIPGVYILHGKFLSGINLYFVIGVLFCVILLDGAKMWISVFSSVTVCILCMIYEYSKCPDIVFSAEDIGRLYIEDGYALILCGITAGICVKCKAIFFNQENDKAESKRYEAEKINESKNVFFSNMSHEIRTPMNAILGASQLLMDSDIPESSKDNVLNILNACNALISSVGDLLDFSRIDSKGVALIESESSLSEMLEDIINMISIRVLDKGIDFFVDIDSSVPQTVIMDSKHLRKIYITMLNNSIKYTKEGYVLLSVRMEKDDSGRDIMVSSVRDTGISISTKDMDTEFGFSICESIIEAMQGKFEFKRVENKGNEFEFRIPLNIPETEVSDSEPVIDKAGYRVLIFEHDENSEEMLLKALEQYGIKADAACGAAMFREYIKNNTYTHIFIDSKNYTESKDFIESIMQGVKLIVIANVNQTGINGHPGNIIMRPVYYNNIKAIFENRGHTSLRKISMSGDFKCPGVKVMAVDDNSTNLMVIESILKRYDMEVYTASGGQECIYMLEDMEVDIIFLDFMMPGMDGVDTLKNIRAMNKTWTKNVPIITLTANAVAGVREMLLGEGFDEYLSKPIEISKLEKCICKFLPDEKIVINREDELD